MAAFRPFAIVGAAVFLGFQASAATGAEPAEERLFLHFADLAGLTSMTLDQVTCRVRELLRPIGVSVESGRIEPGEEDRLAGGVIVTLLARSPGWPDAGGGIEGAAGLASSRQRTVWVIPARVAAALGLDFASRSLWHPLDRARFARAVAVVVAHEIVHVLLGVEHRGTGLLAPRLSVRTLTDPSVRFDPDLAPALHRAMATLRAPSP